MIVEHDNVVHEAIEENEETDIEYMAQGPSLQYIRVTYVDDVDHIMNEVFPLIPTHVSPPRIATIKSPAEETNNLDIHVSTSNVDTNILNVETPSTSAPVSTIITPPEVVTIKSNTEEIRNLNISEHTSNVVSYVNIGETITIDP